MITFREIAPNKFVLLRESIPSFYMHDKFLTKLEKSRSLDFERIEEHRGTNEKFWLINDEFNYQIMFKSNHRAGGKVKENGYIYGELITDLICKRLGLANTSYYPCNILLSDGSCLQGTMAPSYLKGKYNHEYSGESITKKYIMQQYDNNNGLVPHIEYNTVYEYIKQIKSLYGKRVAENKIQEFKEFLLEVALIDYMTCQTDRHWGNIGWMNIFEFGIQTLTNIPLYDNESCFLLNKPLEWIKAFAEKILKSKDGKKTVVEPMLEGADRTPRLGIKTATTVCKDGMKILKKPLVPGQKTNIEVIREELAEEIINNKKLAKYLKNIKNLNIEQELRKCNYFPEEVITVVKNVWEVRIKQLEKVLQSKLEQKDELSL